jgi:hypothetical protein
MKDMSTGVENTLKCVIKVEEEALQIVQSKESPAWRLQVGVLFN